MSKKVLDSENKLRRKQANKAKCEVQWNWKYQTPSKCSPRIESLGSINARTSPGFYSLRRQEIHYFFLLFGSALQEDWDKLGLVEEIVTLRDRSSSDGRSKNNFIKYLEVRLIDFSAVNLRPYWDIHNVDRNALI